MIPMPEAITTAEMVEAIAVETVEITEQAH
jgi:hypothetical protein